MRRLAFVLLAFMTLTCGFPAQAQEDVLSATPQADVMTPKDELDRKKYSEEYYQRCMQRPLPNLSSEAQDQMCMCHMVHMLRYLKTPEIETMGTGKGKVTVNPKRLLPQVYAPCLEFQIEEEERENCYDSNTVKDVVLTQNAYDAACACVTEGIVGMVRETAQPLTEMLMSMGTVRDLYTTFTGSMEYTQERQKIYRRCINTYGGR